MYVKFGIYRELRYTGCIASTRCNWPASEDITDIYLITLAYITISMPIWTNNETHVLPLQTTVYLHLYPNCAGGKISNTYSLAQKKKTSTEL